MNTYWLARRVSVTVFRYLRDRLCKSVACHTILIVRNNRELQLTITYIHRWHRLYTHILTTTEFAARLETLQAWNKHALYSAHRRECEQRTTTKSWIKLVRPRLQWNTLATLVYSTVDNGLTITWLSSTGNCKLGHDCSLRCRQICSDSSRLSPTSCELRTHSRRDATRQLRRVGGVYWAIENTNIADRPRLGYLRTTRLKASTFGGKVKSVSVASSSPKWWVKVN